MSKESDIDAIMENDTRKIIRTMLEDLWTGNNNTFVSQLRMKLSPKWYDGIWGSSDRMMSAISEIFTYKREETRHYPGGSWSPECDYTVKLYTCNLCGDIVDEEDIDRHLQTCSIGKEVFETSDSLEEYTQRLLLIART